MALAPATRLLHLVAQIAIRVTTPREAKRWVDRLGAHLPPIDDADRARELAAVLDRAGTCLSRSLALAARVPGAEVAIGVDPSGRRDPLTAHAWVEVNGEPLRATDVRGEVIARLGPPDRAPTRT